MVVSAAVYSSLRRRRGSPSVGAFFAPMDLADLALIQTLLSVSGDVVATATSACPFAFQRRNSRSLVRKIKILMALFEFLKENCAFPLPSSATLCFKELYILFYRSKILLDYCAQSSRIWLLIKNSIFSGCFHDLDQDIATLLDVFPAKELNLSPDVGELVQLLRTQSRRAKLFVDPGDESLRFKLFSFLDLFEHGKLPDPIELRSVFIDGLGICDAKACRAEIEFLEEQIYNQEEDLEPSSSLLNSFVALARYVRFLLFGFEDDEEEFGKLEEADLSGCQRWKKGLATEEIGDSCIPIPKDFCCPISFDLMRDPVIVSTGQTYDRSSILRWIEEGHCSCPKTGQILVHTRLVPNRALRGLILQWCAAQGIPYDSLENGDVTSDVVNQPASTRATIEANRATALILVEQLSNGSDMAQTVAARELRLLAKTGRENRSCIAEAGAIPLLKRLLSSSNPIAQENAVTAMLNLSILDKNKSQIMEEEGCLESIVDVLKHGITEEARENAAASLFSLSAVHDYKKRITDQGGAVEALAGLLRNGSPRGKKDAVTALFNLSTHPENCVRMVDASATSALVGALFTEGVADEAAGALALLVRQRAGAEAVGQEDDAVVGLIGLMRGGTPRGKENAVAALLELCRSGGSRVTEQVVRAPSLASLLQSLLFRGTKRARRKAASLARVCQRCEAAMEGWGAVDQEYRFSGASGAHTGPSFVGDVSVQMSITVPVL